MKVIDLRSDTLTKPTPEMRRAIEAAEVGDDVYGEDPAVNMLQEKMARTLGFAQALFMPTGTMSNLTAIMSHCERGDEYITGQNSHAYKYEAGGAAVLGSVQPQPINENNDGTLDLEKILNVIKPHNLHFAKSKLLVLENTMQGKVLPIEYLGNALAFARHHNLKLHLDGARLYNAACALELNPNLITSNFDSATVCLSKSLGAPAGSMLLGDEEFINKARRIRKMLGGGMRQSGILASACLYALEHHVSRLAQDHEHAKILGNALSEIGFDVEPVQTNMVFIKVKDPNELSSFLFSQGINVNVSHRMRLVTHLDISVDDIDRVIDVFKTFVHE